MLDVNLNEYTLDELKALHSKLAKAIDTYEDRRRKEAIAAVEAKAKEMGYTIAELLELKKKEPKPALPAKFVHPDDPSLTWSGRGRKPHWIAEAIAAGATLESLMVE